jgi:hypothetical protein
MQSLLSEEKKQATSKTTAGVHAGPSFDANCVSRKEEVKASIDDYNKTSDTIRPECNKKPNKFKITEIKQEMPKARESTEAEIATVKPKESQDGNKKDSKLPKIELSNVSNFKLMEYEKECRGTNLSESECECVPSRKCFKRREKEPVLTDPHLRYLLEMEKMKQASMVELMETFCHNCMDIAKASISSRVDD